MDRRGMQNITSKLTVGSTVSPPPSSFNNQKPTFASKYSKFAEGSKSTSLTPTSSPKSSNASSTSRSFLSISISSSRSSQLSVASTSSTASGGSTRSKKTFKKAPAVDRGMQNITSKFSKLTVGSTISPPPSFNNRKPTFASKYSTKSLQDVRTNVVSKSSPSAPVKSVSALSLNKFSPNDKKKVASKYTLLKKSASHERHMERTDDAVELLKVNRGSTPKPKTGIRERFQTRIEKAVELPEVNCENSNKQDFMFRELELATRMDLLELKKSLEFKMSEIRRLAIFNKVSAGFSKEFLAMSFRDFLNEIGNSGSLDELTNNLVQRIENPGRSKDSGFGSGAYRSGSGGH